VHNPPETDFEEGEGVSRMVWKLSLSMVVVLSLVVTAGAMPTPVGTAVDGGSWSQAFREFGVGDFDSLVVQWHSLTPPSAEVFEPPTFRDLPADWTIVKDDGMLAVAGGAPRNEMVWSLWFAGGSSTPLAFDFAAFSGTDQVDGAYAYWSGQAWSITSSGWAPPGGDIAIVPAPGALLLGLWGSLGVVVARATAIRRRYVH
jgi:hypothetical protein